jgi:hypothetical protein
MTVGNLMLHAPPIGQAIPLLQIALNDEDSQTDWNWYK